MTERLKGFLVTLKNDIREDDAEAIALALRMVKGVTSVEPIPSDINDRIARQQVRREVVDRLYTVIDSILQGE